MARLFVSHSSRDRPAVQRLRDLLAAEHVAAFIDFDPDGIPPGRRWEDELNWQLASCVAVLYVCSENSNESRWCFAELAQARSRHRPVIALRLDGAPLPPILSDTHAVVDFGAPEAELRQRLAAALALAQSRREAPFAWDGKRPLYPGMTAFDEDDAAIFFGRDAEIDALVDLLGRSRLTGRRLACVVGASGSGKSSVVRAGVLPRLRRSADQWIVTRPLAAGPELPKSLAEALVVACPRKPPSLVTAVKAVRMATGGDTEPLDALLRRIRLAQATPGERTVLVVIDQAERLFAPDGQAALALLLACAAAPALPLQLLVTMRLDHLDALQLRLAERSLATELMSIGPLPASGIAQAIEGPAALARVEVERELVATLIDEAKQRDGLPLLAFALHELWKERGREQHRLSLVDYRQVLGGLEGAVARCVERAWSALRPDDTQLRLLRDFFLRLARLAEGGGVVGRPAALTSVPESLRLLVDVLVNERLLVTRGDSLEVVHEALFRAWPPLAQWIDEEKEGLAWQRDIAPVFGDWRGSGGDIEAAHLSGRMLETALRWREAHADAGDQPTRELLAFVEASLARAARVERRAAAARVRQLAAQAQVALAFDPPEVSDRGLLLAIEASRRAGDVPEARLEADQAMRQGLALLARTRPALEGFAVGHEAWAAHPTQPIVAFGSRDRAFGLWNLAGGSVQPPGQLQQPVQIVGFSRDGQRLVAACDEAWLVVWQLDAGQPVHLPLRQPEGDAPLGSAHALAFSPDGSRFAIAYTARTLVFEFAQTPKIIAMLPLGGESPLLSIDFSGDGEALLELRRFGPAVAWRLPDGRQLGQVGAAGLMKSSNQVLHSPDGRFALTAGAGSWEVWLYDVWMQESRQLANNGARVAFSRDGRFAAMASPEHFALLWRLPDFSQAHKWRHHDSVWDLDFSPDGRALATAAGNGVVRVFDTDDGHERARIVCPGVYRVRFAGDSRHVITQASGNLLRAWDIESLRAQLVIEAPVAALKVAFDDSGKFLAVGIRLGQGRIEPLWVDIEQGVLNDEAAARAALDRHDAATRLPVHSASGRLSVVALTKTRLGVFDGAAPADGDTTHPRLTLDHAHTVWSCIFSPDESTLATVSERDHVRLWDLATGDEIARLTLPAPTASAAAFSPDGRQIATAGWDGIVRLWWWRPEDLVAEAATRVTRELSADERERHLLE